MIGYSCSPVADLAGTIETTEGPTKEVKKGPTHGYCGDGKNLASVVTRWRHSAICCQHGVTIAKPGEYCRQVSSVVSLKQ